MTMHARFGQVIGARDLRHRLAAGKPTVDLRALEMLTTRTLSTHNIEINMGILIKRKVNCGSGNDHPKGFCDRQKSIVFRNALRAPVGFIEPRSGGRNGEKQKLSSGRVF